MPPTPSAMRWHDAIAIFIQERLQAKLDKLAEDDPNDRSCWLSTSAIPGWKTPPAG